jgi:hypothetical protein
MLGQHHPSVTADNRSIFDLIDTSVHEQHKILYAPRARQNQPRLRDSPFPWIFSSLIDSPRNRSMSVSGGPGLMIPGPEWLAPPIGRYARDAEPQSSLSMA